MTIPDEAIEAGERVLNALPSSGHDQQERIRAVLEAAGPHMGVVEWAIFRASDGHEGTPVEAFRWPSRESAQHFIENGYTQPELWEPRGRIVGEWEK